MTSQLKVDYISPATGTALAIGGTSLRIPNSSSAPSSPSTGDMFYNITDNLIYTYNGTEWVSIVTLSNSFHARGGIETVSGGYKIHTFTSSGTFTVSSGLSTVEYLVIAGGGSGGVYNGSRPGGGGAGGYRCSVVGENSGGGASAEGALPVSSGTLR